MKKSSLLLLILLAVAATSCKTIRSTAEYKDPTTFLRNATVADLDVADTRISFTFVPSRQVRRGGDYNVIKAAIREALRLNGGGDVLVDLDTKINSDSSIVFVTTDSPEAFEILNHSTAHLLAHAVSLLYPNAKTCCIMEDDMLFNKNWLKTAKHIYESESRRSNVGLVSVYNEHAKSTEFPDYLKNDRFQGKMFLITNKFYKLLKKYCSKVYSFCPGEVQKIEDLPKQAPEPVNTTPIENLGTNSLSETGGENNGV